MDPGRAHAALLATFATSVRQRADELGITVSELAEQAGPSSNESRIPARPK